VKEKTEDRELRIRKKGEERRREVKRREAKRAEEEVSGGFSLPHLLFSQLLSSCPQRWLKRTSL
jgi:hypothetical protein